MKMGYIVEQENVLMILVLMVQNAQENLQKLKCVKKNVVQVSFHKCPERSIFEASVNF